MHHYMITYFWAYSSESLRNPDTRGMSFYYTDQSTFQEAYNYAESQIRKDHGSKAKFYIVSITDQTAAEYLSASINHA